MIESNVGDDVLWVGGVWGMGMGYGVWERDMGMMDKGYGGIGIKLEYYPQMCIGDGFIFN